MRAIVTGAAGFVGGWLVAALRARGAEVHGLGLTAGDPGLAWHVGDVRDPVVLRAAVAASAPDAIFHLAGISSVGGADEDPGAAVDVNVTATVRLLAEVARHREAGAGDPAVLVVGSGEQYGAHDRAAQPLDERAEQRPASLYAATKAAQEILALQAWRRRGVRVICARSFNHSGPGQPPTFLLPALVERALRLRAEGGHALRLGNVTPVRDVSHVADVVRAYILLAERGVPGEAYNVCGSVGRTVGDIAAAVLRRVGVDARVESDPALVRPADVPALVGDNAKLRAHAGWEPERTLDDCIDDLIRHAQAH